MQTQFRRFADLLGDALREKGLDPSGPITVAEIYQDLVPYRTHRDQLGVEMNGDYEHLLLRLLAGEGDVLRLESDAALERIRDELDSQNPNTGLYREFAAVDVRLLAQGDLQVGATGSEPAGPESGNGTASTFIDVEDDAPADGASAFFGGAPRARETPGTKAGGSPAPATGPAPDAAPLPDDLSLDEPESETMADAAAPAGADSGSAAGGSSEETGAAGAPCQWCRQVLPDRPNLNFCPFCGTDLRIVPCGNCGEALEPEWRFCIACGDEVVAEA